MSAPGLVNAVGWRSHGSVATEDVAAGTDPVVRVDSLVDFNDEGGFVGLGDQVLTYSTIEPDYSDEDGRAGWVSVDGVLLEPLGEGDPVLVTYSDGTPQRDFVADVSCEDGEELEVELDYADRAVWPEGIYDPPVYVELNDELTAIVHVPGRAPSLDGRLIEPGTLPDPGSDGEPPAASPTPTLIGGIGILHARWSPVVNHDPVTYAVHLSETSGFTPDAFTLLGETDGGSFSVRALADGTELSYGTTYYCRIVASDADGSAAPSVEASGEMHQVTGPDVSAEYVYAGTLNYGQMIGGPIDASGLVATTIRTALSGARVELTPSGMVVYNSAGAPVTELKGDGSTFRGIAALTSATASGPVVLGSSENRLDPGACLKLAEGFGPPDSPPTWGESYDQVMLDNEEPWSGFASLDATYWVGALQGQSDGGPGYRLVKIHKTTGALTTIYNGAGWPPLGVIVTPSHIVVTAVDAAGLLLQRHHLNGDDTGSTYIVPHASFAGTPTLSEVQKAAFGWDATAGKAMMLWPDQSLGSTRLAKFDPVSGGGTITSLTFTDNFRPPRSSITRVGSRYHITNTAGSVGLVYDLSGARMAGEEWPLTQPAQGMAHDGSHFWQINTEALTKYEDDYLPTADGPVWWADYEWFDGVGTTHRSGSGNKAVFFVPKRRAKVTFGSDTIVGQGGPDQPNQARFFVGTAPEGQVPPSGMWLQGAANVPDRTTETVVIPVTSGVARSFTNQFDGLPGTTPACIESNATSGGRPLIQLEGNGDAWIPGIDTWHTITPLNGYAANPSLPPAYRIDSTGRVEYRGRIDIGTATNGATAFTLPVGYRPTQQLHILTLTLPVSVSGRVRTDPDGSVALFLNQGSPTTFILDGISFSTL